MSDDFNEVSVEEDDYDLRSPEDIVADGTAAKEEAGAETPVEDQGDQDNKPAGTAESDKDGESGDAGEEKEDTPASRSNTPQVPEYVKQRKIETLAYENRELKRQLKAAQVKQQKNQPTDEDKQREQDYLDLLSETDPVKYQEELLRINNRKVKQEVLDDIESQQQSTLEEDADANASQYKESLAVAEQRITNVCPHAFSENGQPNKEFWDGENGFWKGIQRVFPTQDDFLKASQENPGIITMIAENANANIERKLASRQTAENGRRDRISGQASSQAKSKASSEVSLSPEQKARCKQLGLKESEFVKYIPRG